MAKSPQPAIPPEPPAVSLLRTAVPMRDIEFAILGRLSISGKEIKSSYADIPGIS